MGGIKMIYYKSKTGEVYAYETEADRIKYAKVELTPIGEQEAIGLANPPPTPEQIEAAKVALVQNHMDEAARALRYDDIKTAVTYAEETAVPKFQAEGQAFRAWRSLVWAACYAILDDVNAGNRGVPTDAELIAELPDLVLPE